MFHESLETALSFMRKVYRRQQDLPEIPREAPVLDPFDNLGYKIAKIIKKRYLPGQEFTDSGVLESNEICSGYFPPSGDWQKDAPQVWGVYKSGTRFLVRERVLKSRIDPFAKQADKSEIYQIEDDIRLVRYANMATEKIRP